MAPLAGICNKSVYLFYLAGLGQSPNCGLQSAERDQTFAGATLKKQLILLKLLKDLTGLKRIKKILKCLISSVRGDQFLRTMRKDAKSQLKL